MYATHKSQDQLPRAGPFRGNLAVAAGGIKPQIRGDGDAPHPHRRLHSPLHPDPRRQAAFGGRLGARDQDGYRLDGKAVRLFTRRGYDWTERYPAIAAAAAMIKAKVETSELPLRKIDKPRNILRLTAHAPPSSPIT
jgi:hypothetical protein